MYITLPFSSRKRTPTTRKIALAHTPPSNSKIDKVLLSYPHQDFKHNTRSSKPSDAGWHPLDTRKISCCAPFGDAVCFSAYKVKASFKAKYTSSLSRFPCLRNAITMFCRYFVDYLTYAHAPLFRL